MKFIIVICLTVVTSAGCTPGVFAYMTYIKAGADMTQFVQGKPTTTDWLVSRLSNKECNTSHILDGKKYCEDTSTTLMHAYVDSLIKQQKEKELHVN